MTSQEDRVAALVARGRQEREELAAATIEVRAEVERRKAQWRAASFLATGIAVTGTVLYRLFGRNSLSAQLGRAASVVSLVMGLYRFFQRIRKFV
jgi:predicted alpha/beta-fold hydrolase